MARLMYTYQHVTELAGIFNQLLDNGIEFRLTTDKLTDCLNSTSLQGEKVKIRPLKNDSEDTTKTLEIILDGVQEGETIESRKWFFQIQDQEIYVTVEDVTEGRSSSKPETIPYFLAEFTYEVFFSMWGQKV